MQDKEEVALVPPDAQGEVQLEPEDASIEKMRDDTTERDDDIQTVSFSSASDDAFIDDEINDQPTVSSADAEIDQAFHFLNRAFSVSAHPNLDLPPDMSIEENRVYNLTSVLNLDIPHQGGFVTGRTYLLPQELHHHLLYRRNPFIEQISPNPQKKQRFKFLPKFVRRLNPFRKK